MRRRTLDLGRGDRGQVLWRIAAAPRPRPGDDAAADGPGSLASAKAELAALFRPGRREWCALLAGTDAWLCAGIDDHEAPHHPHNRAGGTYVEIDGIRPAGGRPALQPNRPDLPIHRNPRAARMRPKPHSPLGSIQARSRLARRWHARLSVASQSHI